MITTEYDRSSYAPLNSMLDVLQLPLHACVRAAPARISVSNLKKRCKEDFEMKLIITRDLLLYIIWLNDCGVITCMCLWNNCG